VRRREFETAVQMTFRRSSQTSEQPDDSRSRRIVSARKAFTLIELLVVVAIIALLISILLPSLGRARAQARTALCGSRISQLTKAILLYADDFSETPPFIDNGYDRPDPNESWIASPNDMSIVLNPAFTDDDWTTQGAHVPQSGNLFNYSRFTDLYRCPEFARLTHGGMMQHRFNYSRSIAGKKWRYPTWLKGPASHPLGDFRGPTMKPSTVFSASSLIMLADEQWNRHIAGDYQYNSDPGTDWPMRADPVMAPMDELGQYHGSPTRERSEYKGLYQSASVTYWDGHVELHRDPQPTEPNQLSRSYDPFTLMSSPYVYYLLNQLHSQQGVDLSRYFLP